MMRSSLTRTVGANGVRLELAGCWCIIKLDIYIYLSDR